jgi:nucleoside-diphosphate-sugar epimerase
MDLVPPLAVYAAIQRERGEKLHYPGGAERVSQAVDVDLLARAIAWAGDAETARNAIFNVTNGDVFTWPNVWPAIAEAFGMEPGEPRPLKLGAQLGPWRAEWDRIRAARGLTAPDLKSFVGLSLQYADYQMRTGETAAGPPSIVSTVKINQAGFTEMIDTEAMFADWIVRARRRRWTT